jgi:16S rRNA (cytidine1402-2'-O)-methyltransferase
VLYESPGRLAALLRDLVAACGADRRVAVARELTKLYETVVRGTLGEVAEQLREGPVRGEIVVVLAGAARAEPDGRGRRRRWPRRCSVPASRPGSVAKELARRLRIPRNDAYALVLSLAGADGGEKD